jgi:hypothetical protein
MGLKTVAGSCLGSPIRINLLQEYIKGIKQDNYTACPPSSITTVSNYSSDVSSIPLPAADNVVKTNLLSLRIFFLIEIISVFSDLIC